VFTDNHVCSFADKHLPKQSFASLPKRKKVDSEHLLSDLSSNDKNHAKRPTTKDKGGKKLSSTNNIDRAERLSTKSKESK